MDQQLFDSRRMAFGEVAAIYDRSRPDYPPDAVRWLVGSDEPRRVLDLGAGTGKLTRRLRELGHDVVAVDPDDKMLQALSSASPEVTALVGGGEQIPVSDESVDVVVAGQSYHWFGGPAAHTEIARVLRPGGVFGPVWNIRDDRVDWVRALSELIGSGEDTWTAWDGTPPQVGPDFGPVDSAEFAFDSPHDLVGLQEVVGSRSYVLTLSPAERQAVLDRVAELARTHEDLRDKDTFALPYVTYAYRAARR